MFARLVVFRAQLHAVLVMAPTLAWRLSHLSAKKKIKKKKIANHDAYVYSVLVMVASFQLEMIGY